MIKELGQRDPPEEIHPSKLVRKSYSLVKEIYFNSHAYLPNLKYFVTGQGRSLTSPTSPVLPFLKKKKKKRKIGNRFKSILTFPLNRIWSKFQHVSSDFQ